MKRNFAFLLAAAMLLCLCACGQKAPADTEAPQPQEPQTPAEQTAAYDDSLISEQLSLEGEYDDGAGNHVAYSYHIPKLESDSADAAAINAAIEEKFGGYVSDELAAIGSQTSLVCAGISWQSYWHGSILCLVVKAVTDWDFDDYGVYSFNFETGKSVSNEELAQLAGMTGEELLSRARAAAAAAFDEGSAGMPQDDFYNQQRDWTLSEENIGSGMMVYLGDGGGLVLILPIGALAGAGWYYHVIEIEA